MARKKFTPEFKQQVVEHYLNSDDGAKATARRFGIDHGAVRRWTEHWKVSGQAGFLIKTARYSAAFKESVVRYMWNNAASSRKAAAIFQIAAACTVSRWERLYRESGILGLQDKPRGRPGMSAKKSKSAPALVGQRPDFTTPEEELEYLRAENAYLKKLHALIQEKQLQKRKTKRG